MKTGSLDCSYVLTASESRQNSKPGAVSTVAATWETGGYQRLESHHNGCSMLVANQNLKM